MEDLHQNEKDSFKLPAAFFFLLLLFNMFTLTEEPVKELALLTVDATYMLAIFALGFLAAGRMHFPRQFKLFYLGMLSLAVLYVLMFIFSPAAHDREILSTILLVLSFLLAVVQMPWKNTQLDIFAYMSAGLILLILVHWLIDGLQMVQFQGLIRNPTIMGSMLAALMIFPIARFKAAHLSGKIMLGAAIGSGVLLIYASSTRAVLLLLIIMAGSRVVLHLSKNLFSKLFYLVLAFNLIFTLIYGSLSRVSFLEKFNEWSLNTFNKSLFSGRQNIWDKAIAHGADNPLFGHEIGILPKDFIEGTHYVHSHNQYLQIFLESGLVGLASFIVLLFGIWTVLMKGLDLPIARWAACYFLGLLFYETVDMSLFHYQFSVGLLQWLIIGAALSTVMYTTYLRKNDQETPKNL
ncbi:O-antigen ligase [Lentibacillus persicus]|uniref:O-antigen ligase n=1 Tax=Lentibacillus persicus TaxID=640948 RepID=A0A1I1VUA1_9BACI|nr:O-antigen ligase family protein [Lentibacillus persicus]SFD86662.1 O-antigen ligase [Lentibacillus persicus]